MRRAIWNENAWSAVPQVPPPAFTPRRLARNVTVECAGQYFFGR
jgi:hypothetical protein